MSDFYQDPPQLQDPLTADIHLQSFLRQRLPQDQQEMVFKDLQRFSKELVTKIDLLGKQAEREEPKHIPYNPWGQRIDDISVSPAWQELHKISAREGIVAIGYERKQGEFSRLYQFAKLHLFHPSSAFYSCPLAMTDGAARVLEVYGHTHDHKNAFSHLTSRDEQAFWTSGQWMTEKTGGSDVSGTRTTARREKDHFLLNGVKWFSSATTAEIALGLARIEGAPEGSRGLSLFYIPVRDAQGRLNGIQVNRLKDKLGTKALPTAELTLQNTKAFLVGQEGQGVKTVATMLNVTRLYNSVCALGHSQRALQLFQNYAQKRQVFDKKLSQQSLCAEVMAEERLQYLTGFALTFHLLHLLGKEECAKATDSERWILRLLTPIAKIYTGKLAVRIASEMLEFFGGAGYIEDTGLPVILRDAQVFPIWEGATNVLSLDLLRVSQKPEAAESVFTDMKNRLSQVRSPALAESTKALGQQLAHFGTFFQKHQQAESEFWQTGARALAFVIAKLYSGTLLLEWADQDAKCTSLTLAAQRWSKRSHFEAASWDATHRQENSILAFDAFE